MRIKFVVIILSLLPLIIFAQNKMKSIDELINIQEPGWANVTEWISKAKNNVEVLSVDSLKAKEALYRTQVTTRSPMGAIIYMTGGILIDHGWIRILGSGNPKLNRTLPEWNKGKTFEEYGQTSKFLLIADDAVGGFFLLNGGGLGDDIGKVYYLSPDNLEHEPLDLTYSDFLKFCLNGDLDTFYKECRWTNWKAEVEQLDGNEVFSFFPYLWSLEGKDINKNSRKAVPIEEQYFLNLEFRKQLGLEK